MRYIYTFILFLLLPFTLIRLLVLMIRYPAYRSKWTQRLGFYSEPEITSAVIWVHAVSVGEVEAAVQLIKALQSRYPEHRLVITTVTPTGAELVGRRFADQLTHFYLPYDLPFAVISFLKHIRPDVAVIMETEIWPNIYHFSNISSIPVLLVNARISDNSYRGYSRIKRFTGETLRKTTMVVAQSTLDGERFLALGCETNKLKVVGNLKYDLEVRNDLRQKAKKLRSDYFAGRSVWIAASTHEGEEESVLSVHRKLLSINSGAVLILAPRHPQRFEKVYNNCIESGLKVTRKSDSVDFGQDANVFLLDSLGDLQLYYAVADLAFVGGSLVQVGGHNLLEPASVGTALVTGPHAFNFKDVVEKFRTADALQMVQDAQELEEKVLFLLASPENRKLMSDNALRVLEENRGGTEQTVELISECIN